MMNMNVDKKDIHTYAVQVESLLSQFDTYFIYLHTDIAEKHMLRTFRLRGNKSKNALVARSNKTKYSISKGYQGLEGGLLYWKDYQDLCACIFDRFKINKIMLNVATGPWSEHYLTLSRRLKLTSYKNIDCVPILNEKISGAYLMRNSNITVNVTENAGSFVISNLVYALEAESVMIYEASNTFFIRGHDIGLHFEQFRQGAADLMKVSSSWNRVDGGIFERTA